MRLIDADELKERAHEMIQEDADAFNGGYSYDAVTVEEIDESPTIEAVPLSEIYRIIAGHSDYHGDSILAAMTCIAEGKEVKPTRPIEAAPVVHGEEILNRLGHELFSAEVYNDDFDGVQIGNLLCLGDVRDVLDEMGLLDGKAV